MNWIETATNVLAAESQGILSLVKKLTPNFEMAIHKIIASDGRVIVCGMGKSGIIGKKIAATLASTGTPAFFMHPGEAYHGDLGMVSPSDIFLAISNSGETEEVIKLLPFLKDNGNLLIAMSGDSNSSLAQSANFHLNVGVEVEACPLQLAPTTSTTAALAMGDAIAVALMNTREFKAENFARFHPGGSLGRRLLCRVEDEMISENLPVIASDVPVADVISIMSSKRMGLVIVKDDNNLGLITDGDLRRGIQHHQKEIFDKKARHLMQTDPITVPTGTRVEDALALMDRNKITSLLIVMNGEVIGVFKK